MAFYSITYDLKEQDYAHLEEILKKFSNGAWCRPTESQWIIHTHSSAKELMQHLQRGVGKLDKLFIIEVNLKNYLQSNIDRDTVNWLERQVARLHLL